MGANLIVFVFSFLLLGMNIYLSTNKSIRTFLFNTDTKFLTVNLILLASSFYHYALMIKFLLSYALAIVNPLMTFGITFIIYSSWIFILKHFNKNLLSKTQF